MARSERKKILIVGLTRGPQEPVGGLEITVLRHGQNFGKNNEVTISSYPQENTGNITEKRSGENFTRYYPNDLESLAKKASESDFIIINQAKELITHPEKTILMTHGGIQNCYPRYLQSQETIEALRNELKNVMAITSCSNWASASFKETLSREVHTVYPPVDGAFQNAFGVKRNVAGYSGRISWFKGADIVLDLAKHTKMRNQEIEMLRLSPDRDMVERFNKADESKLVTILEPFTNPKDYGNYLASLGVTLVPSRVEGFGLVAVEAQISGCFVVASNIEGLPETVHPQGGVLTNGSIEELIQGINENMGRVVPIDVRKNLAEKYSIEKSSTKIMELFTTS